MLLFITDNRNCGVCLTKEKLITNQCSRCGAPLVQRKNELFCEYCQTRYVLPQEYVDLSRSNNQEEKYSRFSDDYATDSPQPTITLTQSQQRERKSPLGGILLVIFGIVAILMVLFNNSDRKVESSIISESQKTELDMFSMNSSAMPDEYPSDFIHNQPLSIGVLLDKISHSEFVIKVYAKNELDRTIFANSKTDQVIISSVGVEDSLGNQYSCDINNKFNGIDKVEPEDIARVGELDCAPGYIPPEVKSINLNVVLTNWGDYDFQIPLDLNFNELEIEHFLDRYDDKFEINTKINATIPQYIVINYDDISVIDDNGNYYQYDNCGSSFFTGFDKYPNFIDLAERYSPGSQFTCEFISPIPYEVNAITFIMNIRGNTVTHTFTTDTIQ